jgi:hypothetical protein
MGSSISQGMFMTLEENGHACFTGVAVGMATATSLDAQSVASTNGGGLPSGFFEEAAAPSEASSSKAAAPQSGLPSGFFEAPGESLKSST